MKGGFLGRCLSILLHMYMCSPRIVSTCPGGRFSGHEPLGSTETALG